MNEAKLTTHSHLLYSEFQNQQTLNEEGLEVREIPFLAYARLTEELPGGLEPKSHKLKYRHRVHDRIQ
eukprot:5138641-Heterocapsa_arctica.AAC.1